ncbi:Ataxin 2-like [Seminavis robusta]|uniref:Ataxin 2-like n=1 Tax=Seminavis robusta TaxID=568900 RepID=A0A9N8DXT5_9STRA|nr:Ataxin 2-like [Seminavis robusta]|eukprot:Sro458_g147160.1 Ataxin 2-like (1089) ;mRNA; r:46781-50130
MPPFDVIAEHWNTLKFVVMVGDGSTNLLLPEEDFTCFQLSVPIKHLYRRKKNTAKLLFNFREKLAQYIIKNAGFKHPYINYIVRDETVCLGIYGNDNYDFIFVENTQEFDSGIKSILAHEGFDPEKNQIVICFEKDLRDEPMSTGEAEDASKPPVALLAEGPKEPERGSDTPVTKHLISTKSPSKVPAGADEPEVPDQWTATTPSGKFASFPAENTGTGSLPATANKSNVFSKGGSTNSIPADSEISGGTGERHSMDLVTADGAWTSAEAGCGGYELSGSIGGWDQFKANEKLVKVKVPPFDMGLYSTKLGKKHLDSRQVAKAERMAREIEREALTLDAVTRIFRMKSSKEDPSFQPKVQTTHIHKFNNSSDTTDLYRLLLSDGTKFIRGFLSESNNHLVENGSLQQNSIISLQQFVMDTDDTSGQQFVVVYKLGIIESNQRQHIGEAMNINGVPAVGVPPSLRQQAASYDRQPNTVKSGSGNSRRQLGPTETTEREQQTELDQTIDEMKNNLSNADILVGQIRRVPHILRRIFGPDDEPSLELILEHRQATEKLALVLVLAMKMHSTNRELQRQASSVVCRASIKVSTFHQAFLKQHGAEVLVTALKRLLEHCKVCHAIVSFFRLLAAMKYETASKICGLRRLHGLDLDFRTPDENDYALLNSALLKAAGTILQALKMHPRSVELQEGGIECLERTSYDIDKQGETFFWDLPCDSIKLVITILRSHKTFADHAKINRDACSLLYKVLHRSTDTIGRTAALLDRTGQAEAVVGLAECTIRKDVYAEEWTWIAFMLMCMVLSRYPHLAPQYLHALMSFWKEQPNNPFLASTGCALLTCIDLGASGMMDNPHGIIDLVVGGAQQARKHEDPGMFEDCTFVLKKLAKSTACLSAIAAVPKFVASITIAPPEDIGCSEEVSVHVIHIFSSLVRDGGISAIMPAESPYCCVHGIINAMSSTPHYLLVQKAAFRLLSMVDFTKADAKLAFTKAGGPSTVIASLSEHFWDEKLSENACKLMNMLTWSSNGLNMQPLLEGLLAADNAAVAILRPARRFLKNGIIWDEGGTSVFRIHDWQYDKKICGMPITESAQHG